MRLYIIRHADPDYANRTITRQGHQEAHALAVRLQEYNLDTIVCSPLGRAQHTARYTADALKLPIETDAWLAELDIRMEDGGRSGVAAWNIAADRVRECVQPEGALHLDAIPELQAPHIKSALTFVAAESDRFFSSLGYERVGHRYWVVKSNPRQIAVFCHNGLGLTWLSHLLSIPTPLMWTTFWLSPSSVSAIVFEEHESGWATPRCICLGDTSHLSAAGLPVQTGGLTLNQY